MLPTINGKPLLECSLEDIQEIIDNPDFRESEYIDYKRTFDILEYKDKDEKNKAKAEFRSDICSFANAQGGYIVFGIDEKKGIPHSIQGVKISNNNPDKFELDIKTWLQSIQPRIPMYSVRFVQVEDGKYIVVFYIQHDFFAPYIHVEDEKNYRIYKRAGNSKATINYAELKNMFIQSMSLEKEIVAYRKERIDYFKRQIREYGKSAFLLIHIIPDTFIDSNYNQPMMVIKRGGKDITSFFQYFEANIRPYPTVDGLMCQSQYDTSECRLYNNGVAETFFHVDDLLHKGSDKFPNGFFPWAYVWDQLEAHVRGYFECMGDVIETNRAFVCFTLVGCKGVMTESTFVIDSSHIDRDNLICEPTVFENIQDADRIETGMKQMKLNYMFSLGIRNDKQIGTLIDEIYGEW